MADAEGGTGEEGATPPFVTRWLPRVVIGAVRLGEDLDWDAVAAWCGGEHGLQPLTDSGENGGLITVDGLGGTEDAYDGDWIVRHTEGFRVWTAAAFASAFASAPLPPDAQPGRTAPSTGGERGAGPLVAPVANPRGLPPLPQYTCGQCGETFGTNFRTEEIECPECEARRCPHCETWFGEWQG
jgi:DNA-directed RNA polymerase subunit RPC12/RpoP